MGLKLIKLSKEYERELGEMIDKSEPHTHLFICE